MEELRTCACSLCKLAGSSVVLDDEIKQLKVLLSKKERVLAIRRHVQYTFDRRVQVEYGKDLKINYVEAEINDLREALSKKQTKFVWMHNQIMQGLCETAKCIVTDLVWP